MATYFQVAIAGHPESYARQAAGAAFREIDRLELELSRFEPGSDISRANRLGPGESMTITPDTLECLITAADVMIATQGAFDPAYASVRAPDVDRSVPPYELDPERFLLTSRATALKLDLGAIGKGYALDRVAEVLREWSITSACLVSGGSSVLALEPPPGQPGWGIGIGDDPHVRTVPLARTALSASGTAVKGSHLVDPRTGKPATRTTRAWALAPNAALSDALSTAFFVFTDAETAAFCAQHPELGAALSGPNQTLAAYGTLRPLLAT